MKLEVHVHNHNEKDSESLAILKDIQKRVSESGVKVAESPEVTAFREQVTSALENIAADIQRLLNRPNSLSQEDKDALAAIAARATEVAAVVPEDNT